MKLELDLAFGNISEEIIKQKTLTIFLKNNNIVGISTFWLSSKFRNISIEYINTYNYHSIIIDSDTKQIIFLGLKEESIFNYNDNNIPKIIRNMQDTFFARYGLQVI